MNIDGDNGLACLTKISSSSGASTITPLPRMYVIKDLVADMTNFYSQYKSVEPWLKRKDRPSTPGKEILQSKKERTSVSFAPAAAPPALAIGGILRPISDRLLSSMPTGGYRTVEISTRRSDWML